MTKSSATRLLRNFILGALAALCLLIAAIRVQQYVLRFRSERLLREVRALDLGQATFADAQYIFRRWPTTPDADPCVPAHCDFEIRLSDLSYSHLGFWANHPQLQRAYDSLGGRPATVTARVLIHDGLIWGKFFRVEVDVFPQETDLFGPYGYGLIASASTWQASDTRVWQTRTLHPDYWIGQPSGCEICVAVYTGFTPFANRSDIQRMMQFDLSCLTRWRSPCRTQGDIMPAAWKQAQDEKAAGPTR
ncbi:MAG: hypothetical protein WBV69_14015 [Candidatus Sulfotelmatobacter sp.]